MGNETGQVEADVDSEGPVAGSWPQGALRFGAWLFGLGFVSVVACFVVVDADILFFVAGGLAIATIAVGLVTAINGRGWDRDATTQAQRSAAQRSDRRALRGGLLLVLGGFSLGLGTFTALMSLMARHWH